MNFSTFVDCIDCAKKRLGGKKMSIKDLQKGNEFVGVSSEIEAGAIASAFVQWLAQKVKKNFLYLNICIGYDTPSAEEVALGIKKGISIMGAHSQNAGLSVTPALSASVLMPYYEFDAAIMISGKSDLDKGEILVDEASLIQHEQTKEDGFTLRFFTADGEIDSEDLEPVARFASRIGFVGEYYECEDVNLMDMYSASVRQYIFNSVGHDLSGLKVAFRQSNGPADFFAVDVLEKLGAEVLQGESLEGADIGIGFSRDASWVAMVTPSGTPLERTELGALVAGRDNGAELPDASSSSADTASNAVDPSGSDAAPDTAHGDGVTNIDAVDLAAIAVSKAARSLI